MQREHTFTVDGLTKQGGRWAYKWGGGEPLYPGGLMS